MILGSRLKELHLGKRNRSQNKTIVKSVSRSLLLIYISGLVTYDILEALSADVDIVLDIGCHEYLKRHLARGWLMLKLFTFLTASATATVCGFKINQLIIRTIGTDSASDNINLKDVLRVPTRATIFSVASSIPYFFMVFVVLVFKLDAETTHRMAMTQCLLIAAVRAPCSIMFVHVNKKRQEMEEQHKEEVEARRRKEIEFAWKTRTQARNQSGPQQDNILTISQQVDVVSKTSKVNYQSGQPMRTFI